jgi:hypothetical protein
LGNVPFIPLSKQSPGYGFQGMAGDFARMFHGDTNLSDDGGLLVAMRVERSTYEYELKHRTS